MDKDNGMSSLRKGSIWQQLKETFGKSDRAHYVRDLQMGTFLIRRVFIMLSVSGCVVMSKRRKFCFSVVRTP